MTVVILSMAAMALVVIIAVFAGRSDKKSGHADEDPDLRPEEKRATVATTAALAGAKHKKPH